MTELELWVRMGVGRLTALGLELGCSKQNIEQLVKSNKHKDEKRIAEAVLNIEGRESRVVRCCKNNILNSAKFSAHSIEWVRKKAHFNLIFWSEQYAKHC